MKTEMFLAFIALAVSAAFAEQDHPYCFLKTCPDRNHTLCKYKELNQPDRRCGEIGVTHRVAPKKLKSELYGVFPHLKWDEELAMIARVWADQCRIGLDKCRNVERFNVTQRFWYSKADTVVENTNPFEGYFFWKKYNAEALKNDNRIGCAAITSIDSFDNYDTEYTVCNFGRELTEAEKEEEARKKEEEKTEADDVIVGTEETSESSSS